ncbi:PQQ-binding-like beta-propeller repeat protein [Bacillus dakarensis]|uniref:outer membrane protein assembly factor BamB family protein n=1 Tax=Robertmurraya dakarensis TaxID=1926278 RepID=UPI000980F384|nr:PQQ-binding-like beta-propeller repeat protein [Bacillus dakarensis]
MEIRRKKHHFVLTGIIMALFMLFSSQQSFANSKEGVLETPIYEACENCSIADIVTDNGELRLVIIGGRNFEETEIVAFNKDRSIKWSKKYDFYVPWVKPAFSVDGTIYLGAVGYAVALDRNGDEKWRYPVEKGAATTPVEGADGTIYFSEFNWTDYIGPYGETNVYAVNENGELEWEHRVSGQAKLELLNNSTLLVSAGPDLLNYSTNGELNWKYAAPGEAEEYEPYINTIVLEDKIYAKSSRALFSLDLYGEEVWTKDASGYYLYHLNGGNADYLIYQSSNEEGKPTLHAVTLNGEQAWDYHVDVPDKEYSYYYIDIYPAEQYLYVGTDNELIKINSNGETEYTIDVEEYISDFIPSNQIGYMALSDYLNNEFAIHTYDLSSGAKLSIYDLANSPRSFTLDGDQNLYFGSDNGLYMLDAEHLGEPDSEVMKIWEEKSTSDVNKQWTIEFNREIDEATVNSDNIYVMGENGLIKTTVTLDESLKSIIVSAPENGYEVGGTYTLYIGNVMSTDQKKLSQHVKMKFNILEQPSTENKSVGEIFIPEFSWSLKKAELISLLGKEVEDYPEWGYMSIDVDGLFGYETDLWVHYDDAGNLTDVYYMFDHHMRYPDDQLDALHQDLQSKISLFLDEEPIESGHDQLGYYSNWEANKYSGKLRLNIENDDVITSAALYLLP